MDLKQAATVCLISLFSAMLVVLIARSLDNQAASRLEPQLAAIAEELRAIRHQGGLQKPVDAAQPEAVGNGLVVYYFHSNARCPTCLAVESGTKATLDADFAPQMARGEIVMKMLNYEKASGEVLASKFKVGSPVVVLVKMKDDKITEWKTLGKVMALAGDRAAFSAYVREGIQSFLTTNKPEVNKPATNTPTTNKSVTPESTSPPLPAIPLPK
jgi:hypothetical protein